MTTAEKSGSRRPAAHRRSGSPITRPAAGPAGLAPRGPAVGRIPDQRHPGAHQAANGFPATDGPADRSTAGDADALVRELARTGGLAAAVAVADLAQRRRLHAAAYDIAFPIVFSAVTRKVEQRRGHRACAQGLRQLTGSCLDGFHDDVEALVEHLFAATAPIADLPAWLTFWAPRAAVDGHRRRRGARGALQRPRMTRALAGRLGHDRWLMDLALRILTWVGVPATAGTGLWPLDEWAQRRAGMTGDPSASTPAVVAAEAEQVLRVLRRRPGWYAEHVERPLSLKPVPVAADLPDVPAPGDDVAETAITELAGAALEAITGGLENGQDPEATVTRVLSTLFLGGSGVEEMHRPPGAGPAAGDRLSAVFDDPAVLAEVVGRVLGIVRETAD
ncbi:hypothetical protein [Actinoplanes auranticolor]|uniref:Uncharacterized protein n=1 Tax=Actinoplanes auranticolor TaxID=47988 RepID=A0A919S7E7_9ACTN|nr:hypothetical protein [Actinoplanes auranticolor]GIM67016.1 hypothetical protein Aau02nite_25540 [Actinoplanes auranticolor]